MRFLCATALAGVLLAGCGQKGPLILPDRHTHPAVEAPRPAAPPASTAPASTAPASAAPESAHSAADAPPNP